MPKIKHEGLHTYRLDPKQDNPREVAFAKLWKKENAERQNTLTVLDYLLRQGDGKRLATYDQPAATVAATVIQWLGSNVGFSFLQEALGNCGYEIVPKGGK